MQTANLFVMIILSGISGVKPVVVQGFLTLDECKQAIPTVVMDRGLLKEWKEASCVPSSSIKKRHHQNKSPPPSFFEPL
jgi:hypothetical protein